VWRIGSTGSAALVAVAVAITDSGAKAGAAAMARWPASGTVVFYSGPPGPLTSAPSPRAAVHSGTPIAAGSCTFFDPETYVIRDPELPGAPYSYSGNVGTTCSNTKRVYCYAELHRVRDSKVFAGVSDSGKSNCVGSVSHGGYRKRTRHYTRGVLQLTTTGAVWGVGRGPRGWACQGQGTTVLICKKSSPIVS